MRVPGTEPCGEKGPTCILQEELFFSVSLYSAINQPQQFGHMHSNVQLHCLTLTCAVFMLVLPAFARHNHALWHEEACAGSTA